MSTKSEGCNGPASLNDAQGCSPLSVCICDSYHVVIDVFLFSEDTSRDSANIVQCRQSGISNCRPVTLDTQHLTTRLQLGQYVKFIAGSDIEMQVCPVNCWEDKELNNDYILVEKRA